MKNSLKNDIIYINIYVNVIQLETLKIDRLDGMQLILEAEEYSLDVIEGFCFGDDLELRYCWNKR
jgi:hypothetical protein